MCMPESQRKQVGREVNILSQIRGSGSQRMGGTMDKKLEAGTGLHLPWLVLLDTHGLLSRADVTLPAPVYRSGSIDGSSSLKRTEERCREGEGRTQLAPKSRAAALSGETG